jgi:hypothetical protein
MEARREERLPEVTGVETERGERPPREGREVPK